MKPPNERIHRGLYPGYHSASFVSFQWFHALYQSQYVCYHRAAISTLIFQEATTKTFTAVLYFKKRA